MGTLTEFLRTPARILALIVIPLSLAASGNDLA